MFLCEPVSWHPRQQAYKPDSDSRFTGLPPKLTHLRFKYVPRKGGFPKLGVPFGDPHKKEFSILGFKLESPHLGKLPKEAGQGAVTAAASVAEEKDHEAEAAEEEEEDEVVSNNRINNEDHHASAEFAGA